MKVVVGMVDKSKAAGSFAGGFFNSPGAVILGALAIGLLFFKDDITKAFGSFGESISGGLGGLGDINVNLPSINLPEINLPDFNFPDFSNIFQGFQDQLSSLAGQTVDGVIIPGDNVVNPDGTVSGSPPLLDLTDQERQAAIDALNANRALNETFQDPFFGDAELVAAANQTEFERRRDAVLESNALNEIIEPIRTILDPAGAIFVPPGDELSFGGGPSFIGGSTTFGTDIIDTFGEVLNIFPNLRANQIDDLLLQNPGLTGSEFRLINPIPEPSISSAGEDPNQILLNAGKFSGLTPEQIFSLISGL